MSVIELLAILKEKDVQLAVKGDQLVVSGRRQSLTEPAVLAMLRENKAALIELINAGEYSSGKAGEVEIPAQAIPAGCARITPDMLPLVRLDQAAIEHIVASVPGGVGNVQDIYPLAPLQEGILYHHIAAEQGDPYVLQAQFAIASRARFDEFTTALQQVIDRHDILRTSVVWEGLDEPVQVVWRQARLVLTEIEIDPAAGAAGEQLRQRFDPRHYRLDISQAPLLRLAFAHDAANQRWVAMLLFHHIAIDHAALEVVQQEIHAHLYGQAQALGEPVPYRNYVAQARLGVSSQQHEVFFREMLGDIDEPTLPFGIQDVRGDGHGVEEATQTLPVELSRRLRAQARQQGVSAASLHHLAWAQVLGRLCGRNDVVFGTVLLGRMRGSEGVRRALGMFINTLPLRVAVGEQDVRAGVKATHARLTALLGHEHASLSLAQRCSGVAAPTPLFSTLLNYRHSSAEAVTGEAVQLWEGIEVLGGEERTNYPLILSLDDLGEGFSLNVQALAGIGAQRVCGYMQTALEQLVQALERASTSALNSLSILPADEREQLLVGFNDTALDYPREQTIHGLFEAQVERTPDALAVVHGEQRLSYRELNEQANRLAHALRKQGVQPDSRVGICVGRGAEMVVGLLAILKAGGGYVPLDPAYPAERIAYMLQDSAPAAVLAQSATQALLAGVTVPVINLDQDTWQDESVQNPQVPGLTSAHLAYLIYTSGSTGLPKGVMIEHRNTVNFLTWAHAAFGDEALNKTLFSTSLNFDLAVYECFAPLTSGGSIDVVKNVLELQHGEHDIGLINTVPSALKALLEVDGLPESVHTVNVAGEALKRSLVESLFEKTGVQRLCNLYGPSETTTYSSWVAMDREDGFAPHIGKPVGNTQFYLLDEQQQPVPLGVPGEIYIGGAGVARGYLNRDDLTAERFLKDPFSQDASARMYRTGDLGRYLPDGNIEYLGRNDDQVKIRGFRIELGEIDARLAKHPAVHEAVVTAREDIPGDKRLVAYYTLADGHTSVDIDSLRRHLQEKLPEYMVPAIYVVLDKLPLTPNGKLDRKALPAPDSDALVRRGYEAPQGETEITLARIWSDLLKVEQVGRHDHFFELGGHSLLAVSLIGHMRQAGLSVDVQALFSQPTLAALATAVGGGREIVVPANAIPAGCEHITPEMLPLVNLDQAAIEQIVANVPGGAANVQDIYPLAPLQEGILYHHLSAGSGDPYVLHALFTVPDRQRLDAFALALQQVIDRHDILRTAVLWQGLEEPVQVVWRQARLHREALELDPRAGDVASQLKERFDTCHSRLDVTRAPLMQLVFAEDEAEQRWVAMLRFHHMALDHTALEVVRHEIQAHLLGQAAQLGCPVPYRNYVAQARLGGRREEHEAFFREMLGDIDEPTLPFGLQDVQGDGHSIEEATRVLSPALSLRLRARARQLGVSAASLHHLAWAQVLGKVSGKQDVVFGTVLMGRMQGGEGADRALGMFINTLPLRVAIGGQGARAGVKATHARLTTLLGHEHASLALAQRCSGVAAPTPLFSALLNYRHSAVASVSEEATQAWQGIETLGGEERTNYPLTLNVDDLGEGFSLNVQVNAEVGAMRVCAYMEAALEHLLQALEQNPEAPLSSLSILPADELEQLLVTFNDTLLVYPQAQTVHGLFEAQVQRTPDALAVVHGGRRLTYRELNEQANRLAHTLRKQGVQPDSRVGICVDRGAEMVVGLLAILKAGGGYVPLDPAYPAERIAYMLQDSAPAAVLAQAATRDLLAGISVPVINLDQGTWQDESVQNPEVPGLTSAHLAYLIYTSGSTGLPKGVMIEHRNTVNFLTWAHAAFGGPALEKTLFSTSLNFDLAVYECFAPLISGGSIEVVKNVLELQQGEHDIGLINTVPSALKALLEVDGLPESVHTVNVAGEALKRSLVESLFEKTGVQRLCNLYGPSETTTYSSWVSMDREDGFAPHIGKPVGNTQFYLLDEQQQPVPLGVPGEIYIGGAGVARGYLNREDLTAERFLNDPFSREASARMYRTGDLGRYLPDGNIEYLGRNDDQVKIRGFRIELGEIDARLAKHPTVHEAVVTAREDIPGDKRLVAYYTLAAGQTSVDIESLRSHLQEQLPEYMVPAIYVLLEAMPLTPNGKLDRKALPTPDGDALIRRGYEAPQGETETTLARIWMQLLNVEQVGRHDHFFDLGGHSLLAVSLIERMRQAGLSADVRVLFGQPTLAALAAAVGGGREIVVPANAIPTPCAHLTPDMLPLVTLDQAAIDRVVAKVPGGAANVQDIYPLAPLQEGILYHHHLAVDHVDPYLQHALFAFDSRDRLDAFAQALQGVIARHDILRTAVVWEGLDTPLQVVWRQATLALNEVSPDPLAGDTAGQLRGRLDSPQTRLDIRRAPMLQLDYAQDPSNQRWIGLLQYHHLVNDATSLGALVGEIEAHMQDRQAQLPVSIPYRNYVAQSRLGVSQAEHEQFFREMLGDIDEPTLPFGLQDVQGDGQDIEEARCAVDSGLSRRLRTQARQLGVSAASLCHLAWARVLGAVSSKDEVVFGTVLLGRLQGGEGADRALGMFINTLPLRVALGGLGVREGVKATHSRLTALLGHEHAPLTLAQRCSGVAAPTPLFSALLNYRHLASGSSDLPAWNGIEMLGGEERTNYPLTLSVDDLGEDFALHVGTLAGTGAQRVCGYMLSALESLVEALEQTPALPLAQLSILPAAEREQLLVGFNASARDYPRAQTVHGLFEAQVRARPEACAAIHDGVSLTYAELNTRANRLARHLRGLGVQPGDSVAILLERSHELLVSQLAVLKCGAVYVPLDINAPVERQGFMIEDSQARVLLTRREVPLVTKVQRVDLDHLSLERLDGDDLAIPQSSESVAYIMYTSGSTGTPKGVLVPHRAISRLVINNGYADFDARDRVAFASNPAFDASTLDVWAPLLNGGCVVVIGQVDLLSPDNFQRLLLEQSVTVLWMTAGLFHQYAAGLGDAFSRLRYLIVGGDVLDPAVIARVLANAAPEHLLNGYGPTEATTFSATYEITRADSGSLPIGRPVGNGRLYVLDAQAQPVPLGVIGELYIGGLGVAKGYLNRDELTREKFVADPFDSDPQARLYRTGDLARWRADGNLEYLGRNDDQVKIRGFRVELGEIEARLAEHPEVKEAVVLCREETPGDKRLVAYFTPAFAGAVERIDALRGHLHGQLPEYMVPMAYVRLERLPLTANGKLDRKALPAPDERALISRGYEAPEGATETLLAQLWSELLKVEQVGRHDHFFELGGHSLLAVTLIERMRQAGLSADVRVLFSQPTLAALAAAVGSGREIRVPANGITLDCSRITPELLPLANLDQAAIDRIVATVPGGVANVQDIYALAPLQAGILYHHLSAEQGDPYVLQSQFAFDSLERLEEFASALQFVIQRHDILRTALVWESLDEPVQVVWRQAQLVRESLEPDPQGVDVASQLHQRFDSRDYRLDIRQAPMLRLIQAWDTQNQRWLALLLFHHLAMDHTAMDVVQHEMQAYLLGQQAQLGAPVPYRNYVAQARLGVSQEEHERFFRERLGDVDEPTLPFGLQLADVQGIDEARLPVGVALGRRLRVQARQLGVSAASLVHLAWAQVLGRVSARDDVVFGTVLMGRMQGGEGADRALGMFINTLPLRVVLGARSAREGVKTTHDELTALLGHEHASLALAQRCSAVSAPLPLFSALLNYRHSSVVVTDEALTAWHGMQALGGEERTNYPLTLNVDDQSEDFLLTAQTVPLIAAERICAYMQRALHSLVDALEQTPQAPLQDLSVLPEAERRQLLEAFNATAVDYPQDLTLHGLFEARVATAGDAVAVVDEKGSLTYDALNRQANRIAHRLIGLGIGPDDRVAICVDRSLEMVAGLMGILKAGAAYVPLDPDYPIDRLTYMLENCAPAVVLSQEALRAVLPASNVPVLLLDPEYAEREGFLAQPDSNPLRTEVRPEHLAYVIYTSGSTGQPKGVMNEHRGVVNRLLWMQDEYGLDASDSVLQKTPFSFDVSVWEFFWPLFNGARLVMARPGGHRDPGYLREVIREQKITTLHFVPSMLDLFLAHGEAGGSGLLRVMCSGEALPGHLVRRFKQQLPEVGLFNLYGPTEAAVDVTAWDCTGPETPDNTPIGKPVANTRIYLLDANRQPAPLGVAGELYIGGVQVARGYLNRPELSAERFLDDPFNVGRMYRTGDLGRYLPDGTVEYLGRNDDQVKIRGFRIELGEIEARLAAYPGVKESVVLAREDNPGEKRLVAYVTAQQPETMLEIESLRTHLQGALPEYMVPAAYVQLDALPLTPNGKLNRKALPAPDGGALISREYEAPQGEAETVLAQLWAELLKVERVGRHDNFFELGGHSLLAVTLIERMRQFGLSADVRVLFGQPTLSALAAAAGGSTEIVVPANLIPERCEHITPDLLPLVSLTQAQIDRVVETVPGGAANVQDIYPLAPLQEGILFHHLSAGEGDPYVLQSQFSFDSRQRLDDFIRALQSVIDRHDVLRTSIVWEGLETPVQVVWRQTRLMVEFFESTPGDAGPLAQLLQRFDPAHLRLNLQQAPLLHLAVSEDTLNQRWVGVLLFHHIAIDHTTIAVVQQEMQASLRGQATPLAPAMPYRNYVAQARLGVSQEAHETFFREMLGDIDEPTLPFEQQEVRGDQQAIAEAHLTLDLELSQRLRGRARQSGVSAASLVHLAWGLVLGRLCRREKVVFGTVLLGRMQGGAGADRALGMFINTLPLRLDLGEMGTRAALKAAHGRLTALLGHEHASLALAQRCSGVPAPTPLFSALLNYRHGAGEVSQQALDAWQGIESLGGGERTNYPLTLSVDDNDVGFSLTVQATAGVDAQRVCGYMQVALASVVGALEQNVEVPLGRLSVLPATEREQLLFGLNATVLDYPQAQTIHGLFEAQVQRTPQALAVVHGGKRLTYLELNEQANRLAHTLRKQGVRPDSRVGICVERGAEMVVGLLAILKAGGGYVPLDPAYPAERIAYMLQDSAPAAVLAQTSTRNLLAGVSVPVINLDQDTWQDESAQNPQVPGLTSAHLAYLIYTSGSTGLPKGVMIEHRNTVNFLTWAHKAFDGSALNKTLFSTSLNFDLAVYECFAPLTSGGSIDVVKNVLELQHGEHDIGLINTVPSALKALLEVGGVPKSVHTVNVAGEALKRSLVESLFEKTGVQRLCNLYGPSETTTYSSWVAMDREDGFAPHIGKPVGNTRFYLLDEQQQPVPLGVPGEIYIGGAGVARGYLNRDDLTAERFLQDPFAITPNARMYRTGDLGRYLADGNIEYLGRNDDQVKIRGFRIELGEIEACLAKHPEVQESVVMAREDVPGETRLVAYFTLANVGVVPDSGTLRAYLQGLLPDYMLPAAYMQLDALPLTPNGKLDRKALPVPDSSAYASRVYEAPVGEVEVRLAALWADLLKVERVGRHDHFFELGGHSLLAVSLIERMRQANLEADVRVLFGQPTLIQVAASVGTIQRLEVPQTKIPMLNRKRRI
ncbi:MULTISPECIES: non-ribosomal peptide synthetase [Pseudomonas]|uniref:non-ribosomal peptide synthetase n=1 Tax=Pseudomonas TaxID=286 RepID=UPI001FF151B2